METYGGGFRSTEEEAPDLPGRGQDRILGGRDIIPLGQAGGNLEGVGDTEQLRVGLNNVHTCACV